MESTRHAWKGTYLSESIARASVMVNRAGFQVCPDGSMRHASEATHFHVRHVQLEHREAILSAVGSAYAAADNRHTTSPVETVVLPDCRL